MGKYAGPRKKIEILRRTSYRCAYCGCDLDQYTMTVDHLVSRKHGGPNSISNLVASCSCCNSTKGSLSLIDSESILLFRDRIAIKGTDLGKVINATQVAGLRLLGFQIHLDSSPLWIEENFPSILNEVAR